MRKKLISLLLVAATLLTMATPMTAGAAEVTSSSSFGIVTNPLYDDPYISDEVRTAAEEAPVKLAEAETKNATYVSVSEASKQLRDAMVNRETSVTLYVQTSSSSTVYDLFANAYSEEYSVGTTDGDYLRWSWGSWSGSATSSSSGITFNLTISYYTTAEQEATFQSELADVMSALDLSGTNYEKYLEIYTYVTNHVSYDHDGLSQFENSDDPPQSYYLIFTAYAAMHKGTAVCQGYATMYYAMCKYAGLPVRVITSVNHAYNIIKLGSYWYYVDSTWDAYDPRYGTAADTHYFATGTETFRDHASHEDEEPWNTEEFLAQYPINSKDYVDTLLSGSCGDGLTWTLEDGRLTISGEGPMQSGLASWKDYSSAITLVIIESGVTSVADSAFANCSNLATAVIPDSVTSIGEDAFDGCDVLTICGYTDSCAESYAVDHDISFLEIDENGHAYQQDIVMPTCTAQGYTIYTCVICGHSYKTDYVAANGHTWDSGTITSAATCTGTGIRTYSCKNCSATKEETLSALGHSYVDTVTPPTTTEQGYTTHTCSRCGYSYRDNFVDPVVSDGWQQIDGVWYYYQNGVPVTGWQKIGGTYYYFDASGAMQTGWLKDGGKWYYLKSSGAMATGWQKIGGTYYYFASSGAMKTGWLKDGGKWYYLKSSGAMVTGWYKIDGTYYYFASSGAMKTGWLKDGGKWYYLKSSGAMTTGWYKISGSWYYFTSTGAMKTGWLQLGSNWYYLKSSGEMVTGDYTIGGKIYHFDDNGVWIP